jgi:hypothetical protein
MKNFIYRSLIPAECLTKNWFSLFWSSSKFLLVQCFVYKFWDFQGGECSFCGLLDGGSLEVSFTIQGRFFTKLSTVMGSQSSVKRLNFTGCVLHYCNGMSMQSSWLNVASKSASNPIVLYLFTLLWVYDFFFLVHYFLFVIKVLFPMDLKSLFPDDKY